MLFINTNKDLSRALDFLTNHIELPKTIFADVWLNFVARPSHNEFAIIFIFQSISSLSLKLLNINEQFLSCLNLSRTRAFNFILIIASTQNVEIEIIMPHPSINTAA